MEILAVVEEAASSVPVWALVFIAALGGGGIAQIISPVVKSMTGRTKTTAEVASIKADTAAKVGTAWEGIVDHLQIEVAALHRVVDLQAAEVAKLRARLDLYAEQMRLHGIEVPFAP